MPRSDTTEKFDGRTLGLFLADGFALMSYAAVIEPFRAANHLAGRELYRWTHISVDGRPVCASNGASILADRAVGRPLSWTHYSFLQGAIRLRFPMRRRLPGLGALLARMYGSQEFPAGRSSWRAQGYSTVTGQLFTGFTVPLSSMRSRLSLSNRVFM